MKKQSIGICAVLLICIIQNHNIFADNIAGNAILFDGLDDFVRIPDAPHLDGMASLTIETWFCPLEPQGFNRIVWKSDGGDIYSHRSYEVRLPNGQGQARVEFFSGTSGWTNLNKNEVQVTANQWIHVATTYDSINGVARLYLNGQLAASVNSQAGGDPISEAIRKSNQDLFLGASFGYYLEGGGTFAHGLFDEFRMWDYARSESQISQNFNKLVNPSENGLIGYWNFDESSGTQAIDSSSFHDNGIISGALRTTSTAPIIPEPCTLLLLGLGGLLIRKR